MPDEISDEMPDHMPERMPLSDTMPERSPVKCGIKCQIECQSINVSEYMSDRMAKYMSQYLPRWGSLEESLVFTRVPAQASGPILESPWFESPHLDGDPRKHNHENVGGVLAKEGSWGMEKREIPCIFLCSGQWKVILADFGGSRRRKVIEIQGLISIFPLKLSSTRFIHVYPPMFRDERKFPGPSFSITIDFIAQSDDGPVPVRSKCGSQPSFWSKVKVGQEATDTAWSPKSRNHGRFQWMVSGCSWGEYLGKV